MGSCDRHRKETEKEQPLGEPLAKGDIARTSFTCATLRISWADVTESIAEKPARAG